MAVTIPLTYVDLTQHWFELYGDLGLLHGFEYNSTLKSPQKNAIIEYTNL